MTSDTYVIYIDEKLDNPSHGAVNLAEKKMGRMIQHIAIDETLKRMKSKSTSQFILVKMNVKLGLPTLAANTLIISYDVCHSSGAKPYTKGESTMSCVLNAILRGIHEAMRTRKTTQNVQSSPT
ncbi:unnamed protein product [Caenorhabditis brenneri]